MQNCFCILNEVKFRSLHIIMHLFYKKQNWLGSTSKQENATLSQFRKRLNRQSLSPALQEKAIKHIEYVQRKALLFQLLQKSKISLSAFDIGSLKIMTVATTEGEKQTEDWLLGRLVMSSTDLKKGDLISFLSLQWIWLVNSISILSSSEFPASRNQSVQGEHFWASCGFSHHCMKV